MGGALDTREQLKVLTEESSVASPIASTLLNQAVNYQYVGNKKEQQEVLSTEPFNTHEDMSPTSLPSPLALKKKQKRELTELKGDSEQKESKNV